LFYSFYLGDKKMNNKSHLAPPRINIAMLAALPWFQFRAQIFEGFPIHKKISQNRVKAIQEAAVTEVRNTVITI
jgi:hypothetical protein